MTALSLAWAMSLSATRYQMPDRLRINPSANAAFGEPCASIRLVIDRCERRDLRAGACSWLALTHGARCEPHGLGRARLNPCVWIRRRHALVIRAERHQDLVVNPRPESLLESHPRPEHVPARGQLLATVCGSAIVCRSSAQQGTIWRHPYRCTSRLVRRALYVAPCTRPHGPDVLDIYRKVEAWLDDLRKSVRLGSVECVAPRVASPVN